MCVSSLTFPRWHYYSTKFSWQRTTEAILAYLTLPSLREFAEKSVWPQRRGPLLPTVTIPHCVGVPKKRQQSISVIIEIKTFSPDLPFQSDSCVNIIKV